jgi:hypothetical protein
MKMTRSTMWTRAMIAASAMAMSACDVVVVPSPPPQTPRAASAPARTGGVVARRATDAPGAPTATHQTCVIGQHLSGPDRRDRAFHWDLVQGARHGVKPGQQMSLTSACQFAKDFAKNCPAWDPEVEAAKTDVCTLAEDPCAEVANWAESTKRASASMVNGDLLASMKPVDVSALSDPNDARRSVADVRKKAGLLRCYDTTAGAEMDEKMTRWIANLDTAITQELACRASPECMAQRTAGQLCGVLAERRDAAHQIQVEKSNPGGVVDLETLHDLGQKIQFDDANAAQLRARYATLAHRPFSEAACPH